MRQTTEKIPLDLVPFAAKAIARHSKARHELDAIYEQGWLNDRNIAAPQKKIYNRYYRQSDPLTEIYCHKATRLLAIIDQGDGEIRSRALVAMEQIIKKCWHDIYVYIKHAEAPITFDSFWLRKVKKTGKINRRKMRDLPLIIIQPSLFQPAIFQISKISRQTRQVPVWRKNILDGEFAIFLSLAAILGKSILGNTDMFNLNLQAHLIEQEFIYNSAASPALSAPQKVLADALWQAVDQMLNGIPGNLEEFFHTAEGQRYKYRFKPEQLNGLPFDNIRDVIVSRKELRNAINNMASELPAQTTVTATLKQEALDLFAQTLFNRACAAEYEKLRNLFMYKEIRPPDKPQKESQNDILQKQLSQAQKKNLALEQALVQKQEALNELQLKFDKRELCTLQEKEQLQKKLDAVTQALSKLPLRQNEQPAHEPNLPTEAMEKIALLNVVILGGRIDWQQRLKQKYPNFSLISSQDVRFDLALLDAADVIAVNWRVLGHSLFHRAIRYAEKLNKKVVYLGMNNERHLLQTLYRECVLPAVKLPVVEITELKNEFQNEQYMPN